MAASMAAISSVVMGAVLPAPAAAASSFSASGTTLATLRAAAPLRSCLRFTVKSFMSVSFQSLEMASQQSFPYRPRQRHQSVIREGRDATDVDFTQNIGIFVRRRFGAEEEIGIPKERERLRF